MVIYTSPMPLITSSEYIKNHPITVAEVVPSLPCFFPPNRASAYGGRVEMRVPVLLPWQKVQRVPARRESQAVVPRHGERETGAPAERLL